MIKISFFRLLALGLGVSFVSGCTTLKHKADPEQVVETPAGFRFKFPMAGTWLTVPTGDGSHKVDQNYFSDGSSRVAEVHEDFLPKRGKRAPSSSEGFEIFRNRLEEQSQGGRLRDVKNTFLPKKFIDTDCLSFFQAGLDNTASGVMNMSHQGMVCRHPTRADAYVMMEFTERWPVGKDPAPTSKQDRDAFLNSLRFAE